MVLSRRTAAALALAGAWTVFTWVTFVRNFDPDGRSTGFVAVHLALAAVNTALGLWLAWLGVRALRRGHRKAVDGAERAPADVS